MIRNMTIVTVCISDIPGPPQGPVEISDIDSDACSISWNKPLEDGGSNITNYVVEKCDLSRGDWVTALSSCPKTSCRLGKLIPGKEYVFRIRAENRFGVSDSIQSDRMVAKFPFGRSKICSKGLKLVRLIIENWCDIQNVDVIYCH